jgi:hypothetical protein
MKYAKPELLATMAAVSSIQGSKSGSPVESFGPPIVHTAPAYEADE